MRKIGNERKHLRTRETCQGSDTSAASSASAACLARRALQGASSNAVNVSKSQNEGCQRGVLASSSSCCKACQSYVRLTLARTAKQLLVTLASTYASNAASNVDAPNVSKCIQMYPKHLVISSGALHDRPVRFRRIHCLSALFHCVNNPCLSDCSFACNSCATGAQNSVSTCMREAKTHQENA